MNYYICLKCRRRYLGWAVCETCEECGGQLERVSQEEFSLEKKRVVIGEEV
jgi:rRNA maturation endonuclease Nob1